METYDKEAEAEAQANSNKYQCHSNPDHYDTERIVCDVCKTVNCKECTNPDWRETGWTVCILCCTDDNKMIHYLLERLDYAQNEVIESGKIAVKTLQKLNTIKENILRLLK